LSSKAPISYAFLEILIRQGNGWLEAKKSIGKFLIKGLAVTRTVGLFFWYSSREYK
jgi:hypothetical protein